MQEKGNGKKQTGIGRVKRLEIADDYGGREGGTKEGL